VSVSFEQVDVQRAAQPSPEIAQRLNGGYDWLKVKCAAQNCQPST
jgi:hypothetical protein